MKELLLSPVLVKEWKLRFRNMKSFIGIVFYLIAMSIFVFGFIFLNTQFTGSGFFSPDQSFILFSVLTFIQLGLIVFITPGLTAGTISTEREKQTLNILLTTSQSSGQIIGGKLSSSISFLLLILVAGLPIYSLVFLFGGISPSQLGLIFIYFFVTMLAIGSIGVFFSTVTRKTIVSMISTYGAMIFFVGITAFFFLLSIQMNQMTGVPTTKPLPIAHFWASINPGITIFTLLNPVMEAQMKDMTRIDFPLRYGFLLFYLVLTVVMVFLSIVNLRVRAKKSK
ncbi:ABC transporter permease [Paenisporosarcina cavernae]|uniref:ABC transporter permease n=1 Tax=Paenisporosarcina cavernae TaxID=2320858 RepID=A0A385YU37_9BACL|nr:ABC transporter permease subunit [Paenisporosarcina cavernae]AYC29082.1 ABC transporter permease [Paenisporosarcina cavernae]